MISKFFIERPVFASVLSIIIVLAGLVAMRALPISQYPQIVPPEVMITATYPGATRADHLPVGRRPARAADQRRREHALHALDIHRQRHAPPHRDLPDRDRPGSGDHQRQQPRAARDRPAAGRSAPPGRHRPQAIELDPADPHDVVAQRALRHDLHLELRPHQCDRRAATDAGGRRCLPVRRVGLFDANLAAARQGRTIQSHARRHRGGGPRAERAVRGRPLRRGADVGIRRPSRFR